VLQYNMCVLMGGRPNSIYKSMVDDIYDNLTTKIESGTRSPLTRPE
jgi:hypothetical protein